MKRESLFNQLIREAGIADVLYCVGERTIQKKSGEDRYAIHKSQLMQITINRGGDVDFIYSEALSPLAYVIKKFQTQKEADLYLAELDKNERSRKEFLDFKARQESTLREAFEKGKNIVIEEDE